MFQIWSWKCHQLQILKQFNKYQYANIENESDFTGCDHTWYHVNLPLQSESPNDYNVSQQGQVYNLDSIWKLRSDLYVLMFNTKFSVCK